MGQENDGQTTKKNDEVLKSLLFSPEKPHKSWKITRFPEKTCQICGVLAIDTRTGMIPTILTYGGVLKWGDPQFSSIYLEDIINHPPIGVLFKSYSTTPMGKREK